MPASRSSSTACRSAAAPVTRTSMSLAGQMRANAERPSLLVSATTTTLRARRASSRLTAASFSLLVDAPVSAEIASAPMTAMSRVSYSMTGRASGPVSS